MFFDDTPMRSDDHTELVKQFKENRRRFTGEDQAQADVPTNIAAAAGRSWGKTATHFVHMANERQKAIEHVDAGNVTVSWSRSSIQERRHRRGEGRRNEIRQGATAPVLREVWFLIFFQGSC